jgi:hypothetical protein
MFDSSVIESKLYGLVGCNNPYDPAFAIVDANNLVSRSSLFATDNPFCKIESLKKTQDYASISDADFNTMLASMQKNAITSVANMVFNESDFVDRDLIYKYAQNKTNVETLPSGFVGYKIEVDSDNDIAFEIKRVILDFQGTGNITLYLWNTGSKTALESKVISITTDNQEEVLDWKLDNASTTYKGDYYIGYNTDAITVQPYKRDYENSNVMTCIKKLDIERVYVSGHNSATLFDLLDYDGMSECNGLNLDLSVYKDYTDLIINNERLFARAIQLAFQIQFISVYSSSVRHNEGKRSGENLVRIIQEIEGQSGDNGVVKVTGLKPMLIGEIALIKKELDSLRNGYFPNEIYTATLN